MPTTNHHQDEATLRRPAVMYIRVCPANHGQAETAPRIEAQRDTCEAFAARRGLSVMEEFVDLGHSRAGLQALIQQLQPKHPTHVVVTRLDRLSRNLVELISLQHRIHNAGGILTTTDDSRGDHGAEHVYRRLADPAEQFKEDFMAAVLAMQHRGSCPRRSRTEVSR